MNVSELFCGLTGRVPEWVIGLILGIFGSFVAWFIVWRVLSPSIGISPQISKTRSTTNSIVSYKYRIKILNMRRSDAMELTYGARLRYNRNDGRNDNWPSLSFPFESGTRHTLSRNTITRFKLRELGEEHFQYLPPWADKGPHDIEFLLRNLPDAELIFTCIASHSYSGSRKSFSKTYFPNDIVRKVFRPKNPHNRLVTFIRVKFLRLTHPELQTITKKEADVYRKKLRRVPSKKSG